MGLFPSPFIMLMKGRELMATINMFDKCSVNVDAIPLQEGQLLIGKDGSSAEVWYDFNFTIPYTGRYL